MTELETELRAALAEGVRLGELFTERPAPAPPWPDLNVLLGWNSAAEETPVREVYVEFWNDAVGKFETKSVPEKCLTRNL